MHIGERRRQMPGAAEWIKAMLVALMLALVLTQSIIVNALVPSESMEDTINTGDRVIGFRPAYTLHEPERGNIIIFKYPDDETQLYVKRVIGLPGDEVLIRNGQVYINGSGVPLDEPYAKGAHVGDFGPYFVPDEHFFVLGDNRDHSWDSRYWTNTYVSEQQLMGEAIIRIFPSPEVF